MLLYIEVMLTFTPQLRNYMKALSSDIKVEVPEATPNEIP